MMPVVLQHGNVANGRWLYTGRHTSRPPKETRITQPQMQCGLSPQRGPQRVGVRGSRSGPKGPIDVGLEGEGHKVGVCTCHGAEDVAVLEMAAADRTPEQVVIVTSRVDQYEDGQGVVVFQQAAIMEPCERAGQTPRAAGPAVFVEYSVLAIVYVQDGVAGPTAVAIRWGQPHFDGTRGEHEVAGKI